MHPSRRSKVTVDSKKGCINPSLLEIEPANCELHLFLRITNVLLVSFLIKWLLLIMLIGCTKHGHVSAATGHINKLGVLFNVWVKEGGKDTSKLGT